MHVLVVPPPAIMQVCEEGGAARRVLSVLTLVAMKIRNDCESGAEVALLSADDGDVGTGFANTLCV